METIMEKYNNLQKLMVNEITDERKTEENKSKTPDKSFTKDINWNLLHRSIYVIEVGELAKKSFVKYGLDGLASHPEVGGRYLRLFGLLSAVFQQKLAIENLLEIYQIEEKKKISSSLNSSEIIELCNKLGVHATYFRNHQAETESQFYVCETSRSEIEVNKIKQLIRKYEFESVDLLYDLKCFDKKVELTLSFIIAEFLKKVFNNQGEYYDQYRLINSQKDFTSNAGNCGSNS
ncbi:hypothetical protein [Rufibacter aurantiacus]|uniref:hypothetical protein n=1 Tax=Rufibacter aurantiacus TaxID=2817374 RepID=UPI001B30E210|nr:hypothetical protein [Rufibacter aurantiacus]